MSTLTCSYCPYVSEKREIFHCLALAVPNDASTLQQVLSDHWRPQHFVDDGDFCHECGALKSQKQSVRLDRWPCILLIHLKRWTVTNRFPYEHKKNDTLVSFQHCMSVPGKEYPYHLRAVIVHEGQAGGGHYTAFVKSVDNSWYYCDDFVSPRRVLIEDVLAANAYMLFYEE